MSRQTTETPVLVSVESTRRAAEQATTAMRNTTERGMNMSRQLVNVWVASTEASLKAAFELQNSALKAGQSLVDTADTSNHTMFEQWANLVRQAQESTLEALQASKRISEQFLTPK